MADWKYVMFQDKDGRCTPILFPGSISHSDIAEYLWPVFPDEKGHTRTNVVSAGFIPALQILGVEGSSDSLKMHSRPEDADMINMMPYAHGLPGSIRGMAPMVATRFCELLLAKLKENFPDET